MIAPGVMVTAGRTLVLWPRPTKVALGMRGCAAVNEGDRLLILALLSLPAEDMFSDGSWALALHCGTGALGWTWHVRYLAKVP